MSRTLIWTSAQHCIRDNGPLSLVREDHAVTDDLRSLSHWHQPRPPHGPSREMMSAMTLPNGRRADEGARPKWRPISFWPWTLAAAAAVVIVAFIVTVWLLAIASGAKPGTDRANARLDAVRTGLAAGAGAGAAVGLMLAFRRQHHQEIATVLTALDATERRITELYAKAVEQLGNDKAPVRLGGLYALERLAQDNTAHRQTIVDVICAYLRMPFSVDTAPGQQAGAGGYRRSRRAQQPA